MDESRRRHLLAGSGLGKAILRERDRAAEADYQQAAEEVRARHPLSEGRRQRLLGASHLGKAVLEHERQLRQNP
jgi:hypothetical protein